MLVTRCLASSQSVVILLLGPTTSRNPPKPTETGRNRPNPTETHLKYRNRLLYCPCLCQCVSAAGCRPTETSYLKYQNPLVDFMFIFSMSVCVCVSVCEYVHDCFFYFFLNCLGHFKTDAHCLLTTFIMMIFFFNTFGLVDTNFGMKQHWGSEAYSFLFFVNHTISR